LRQALEDNFRISQIQRRGRVYGGFVLAAGGEIGEESWLHVEIQGWWKWAEMSYMWDTELLLPLSDWIYVGAQVLVRPCVCLCACIFISIMVVS
jgi:hypothetical protein